MRIGLTTDQGRLAPCFAGAKLNVLQQDAAWNTAATVSTHGWHPLYWGRELMRLDVGLLLCAGIDQATWASIQGHGIQVVPDAMGEPERVLEAWRRGRLEPPPLWPVCPGGGYGRGRRRRFRGGRM